VGLGGASLELPIPSLFFSSVRRGLFMPSPNPTLKTTSNSSATSSYEWSGTVLYLTKSTGETSNPVTTTSSFALQGVKLITETATLLASENTYSGFFPFITFPPPEGNLIRVAGGNGSYDGGATVYLSPGCYRITKLSNNDDGSSYTTIFTDFTEISVSNGEAIATERNNLFYVTPFSGNGINVLQRATYKNQWSFPSFIQATTTLGTFI